MVTQGREKGEIAYRLGFKGGLGGQGGAVGAELHFAQVPAAHCATARTAQQTSSI